jgi:hypothetical protein
VTQASASRAARGGCAEARSGSPGQLTGTQPDFYRLAVTSDVAAEPSAALPQAFPLRR